MLRRTVLSLVPFALLAASPALADAVTYQGTLGRSAIVLELSEPAESADAKLVGRYFYQAKGIDIPLDARASAPGTVMLAEELPCPDDDNKTCQPGDGDTPAGPAPVGPTWTLVASADGQSLSGTWTNKGKALPVTLSRIGTRKLPGDFDGTPAGLAAIVDDLSDGTTPFSATGSPYDFQRLQVLVTAGPVIRWGDVAFHYVTDPRTRFPFPRIDKAGATDLTAANAALEQRHWQWDQAAFSCGSQAYLGLGWIDTSSDATSGLGGWPDESIEVTYLSPTLMSWDEAGSLFCGGAHPDNHDDPNTIDVRTGKPLDMSLIFRGWVPTPVDDSMPKDLASARAKPDDYLWGPDKTLADFIYKHLPPDEQAADDNDNGDCGTMDNIQRNLAITFVKGEIVRFGLSAMPAVAANCNGKLVDVPLSAVKALLTSAAAHYFPSLKAK